MDDEPRLRAKAFILFFRFDEQGVSARVQIGISYGVQSARIGPFVGEALQFLIDIVFVGRYVVGCGKLFAEHALVCIERYLPGVAQGVLQDTGFVPCVYFLSVDDEA